MADKRIGRDGFPRFAGKPGWTAGDACGTSGRIVDNGSDLPLRQITRLRTEMAIAAARLTGELFRDDPALGVEYGVVARVCLPDWTRGGVLAPPSGGTRAITVRRIAASLGTAPETTRRHAHLLLRQGAFVATADGVALAPDGPDAAIALRYYGEIHDLFIRLVEDVAGTCDLDLPTAATPGFGPGDVIGRALEVLLLHIDQLRETRWRMTFLIWAAITAAAVRGVTYDPVLARRYARAIPPDAVRQGVSLRRVAALLGIPYATAWRRMRDLVARDLVTRLGSDGWTVSAASLRDGALPDSDGPSLLTYRKIRELALAGLDPARAGGLYLRARPEPVAFGPRRPPATPIGTG
jgi:hypothetical protein